MNIKRQPIPEIWACHNSLKYVIYSPIKNKQEDQSRQVRRGNIGFLLEGEEDHNHDEAGDDVVTL